MTTENEKMKKIAALKLLPSAKTSIFAGPDFGMPRFFKFFQKPQADVEPPVAPTLKKKRRVKTEPRA